MFEGDSEKRYGFNSVRLRLSGKHYVVIIEKRIAFTSKI
jgi:hypothetical protein